MRWFNRKNGQNVENNESSAPAARFSPDPTWQEALRHVGWTEIVTDFEKRIQYLERQLQATQDKLNKPPITSADGVIVPEVVHRLEEKAENALIRTIHNEEKIAELTDIAGLTEAIKLDARLRRLQEDIRLSCDRGINRFSMLLSQESNRMTNLLRELAAFHGKVESRIAALEKHGRRSRAAMPGTPDRLGRVPPQRARPRPGLAKRPRKR